MIFLFTLIGYAAILQGTRFQPFVIRNILIKTPNLDQALQPIQVVRQTSEGIKLLEYFHPSNYFQVEQFQNSVLIKDIKLTIDNDKQLNIPILPLNKILITFNFDTQINPVNKLYGEPSVEKVGRNYSAATIAKNRREKSYPKPIHESYFNDTYTFTIENIDPVNTLTAVMFGADKNLNLPNHGSPVGIVILSLQ